VTPDLPSALERGCELGLLLLVGVEHRRAILGADVAALAVQLARVVQREEHIEDDTRRDDRLVEGHRDRLRVPRGSGADQVVVGVRYGAARVARHDVGDTLEGAVHRIQTPETTAGENERAHDATCFRMWRHRMQRSGCRIRSRCRPTFPRVSTCRTQLPTTVTTASNTPAWAAPGSSCRASRWASGTTSATTDRSPPSARSCCEPSISASPISTSRTTTARLPDRPKRTSAASSRAICAPTATSSSS